MRIPVLIFTCLLSTGLFAQGFTREDYDSHNYETFAKLPAVNAVLEDDTLDMTLLNAAIFFETNRQRVLQGLKEFKHSPALEKAAYEHSLDMVKYNFFSHTSPVRGKNSMVQRLALVGISNAFSAENIADNYSMNHPAGVSYSIGSDGYYYQGKKITNRTYLQMAQVFVTQWMNSPGHRRNILSPSTIYLGCGAAPSGSGLKLRFKATQNFSSIKGTEN